MAIMPLSCTNGVAQGHSFALGPLWALSTAHARAVATRYDKRGYVFPGAATAAAVVIRLRA
ncbi:hypothetical protein ACFRQM_19635 [Streptomyces sp. NPDC056831]|uniref:hypothetical protein n=1 Tax=Streptomyces sp. NPDC056831 TaxID=3345954 RepID=UPI003692261F